MKFRTTVLQTGTNTTGILVPEAVLAELGAGKRPAVALTVNGYTWRSSVASRDGQYMISASAEVREKAGIAGGDDIDVDLELDTAPREVEVPVDFSSALDAEPAARAFFDTLSYSNKRRYVLNIESAKSEETRQRRIARAVETLREGRT